MAGMTAASGPVPCPAALAVPTLQLQTSSTTSQEPQGQDAAVPARAAAAAQGVLQADARAATPQAQPAVALAGAVVAVGKEQAAAEDGDHRFSAATASTARAGAAVLASQQTEQKVARSGDGPVLTIQQIKAMRQDELLAYIKECSEQDPDLFKAFIVNLFQARPWRDFMETLNYVWPATITAEDKRRFLLEEIVASVHRDLLKDPFYEEDLFNKDEVEKFAIAQNPKIKMCKLNLKNTGYGAAYPLDMRTLVKEGIAIAVRNETLKGVEEREKGERDVGFGIALSVDIPYGSYDQSLQDLMEAFSGLLPRLTLLDVQMQEDAMDSRNMPGVKSMHACVKMHHRIHLERDEAGSLSMLRTPGS